jgi:hypothetical protein
MTSLNSQTKFFAVACNTDKAFKYSELKKLNWIPLKTKSVMFINCMQVHFTELAHALELYNLLIARGILTFKNWT